MKVLTGGGTAFLLLLLGGPLLWMSGGGNIVRETAGLWLSSPAYWTAAACIAAALFASIRKMDAKISFLLCAAGVLLSRMVFFGATVHAAAHIGKIY